VHTLSIVDWPTVKANDVVTGRIFMEAARWPSQRWKLHGVPSWSAVETATAAVQTAKLRNSQHFVGWVTRPKCSGFREESAHHYVRWTVLALIAAVIVGLFAFGLTFLH
jgi:hypothetical protein